MEGKDKQQISVAKTFCFSELLLHNFLLVWWRETLAQKSFDSLFKITFAIFFYIDIFEALQTDFCCTACVRMFLRCVRGWNDFFLTTKLFFFPFTLVSSLSVGWGRGFALGPTPDSPACLSDSLAPPSCLTCLSPFKNPATCRQSSQKPDRVYFV